MPELGEWHRIWSKVWGDLRGRSKDAKLVFFYLLTCQHRATEGLYRLPIGYIVEDVEISPAQAKKALRDLAEEEPALIAYDEAAQVVLILKALTYKSQAPTSANHIKGALNKLAHVPPTPLRGRLLALAKEYAPAFAAALQNGNGSGTHE